MKEQNTFGKDRRAQVGIGTLIIFIAMVLVAAVAAGVLIQTSGFLQQKAAATGRSATEQVVTGLAVSQLVGHVNVVPGGDIDLMAVYLEPNSGSSSIDLSTAVLTLSNGTIQTQMKYNPNLFSDEASTGYSNIFNTSLSAWTNVTNVTNVSGNTTTTTTTTTTVNATSFGIIVLQDADGSLTATHPTLDTGDEVILTINATGAFGGIPHRELVSQVVLNQNLVNQQLFSSQHRLAIQQTLSSFSKEV